jgi:hypothetical protein
MILRIEDVAQSSFVRRFAIACTGLRYLFYSYHPALGG